MKKKSIFIFISIFIFFFVFIPYNSKANFLNEWLTQKVTTNPDYFSGQQRGYFTAGAFSARFPSKSDYLINIESPRVKFGCGGLDIFLGGFNFLNFDYLVEKLQRIMTNAPAVAFDMALSVMCEQCSKTIKAFETIINDLNKLQLDDCKASKVVAAEIVSPIFNKPALREQAEKDFYTSSGLKDLHEDVKKMWKSNDNKATKKAIELVAGCPSQIRPSVGDSILVKVFSNMNYSADTLNLARGLYGDRYFDGDDGWIIINRCAENDEFTVEKLMNGEVYERPLNSTCRKISGDRSDLYGWAKNMIQSISDKMHTNQALTDEEKSFITQLPEPVYSILKTSIMTMQLGAIINNLSDLSAKGYAYRIFSDLANIAYYLPIKTQEIFSKSYAEIPNCKMDIVLPGYDLKDMSIAISNHASMLKEAYIESLQSYNLFTELAKKYESFYKQANAKLAGLVSPALMNKILKNK